MSTLSQTIRLAALAGLLVPLHSAVGQVRAPLPPDAPRPPGEFFFLSGAAGARGGMLGVTPRASSGPADTLGLLLDDVDESMPAAKAGIRRGARLVSIDSVNLRLDAADLGDWAAERVPESRLRRAIAAKRPGDTVTLVVLTDGRRDTKSVTLGESAMARTIRTAMAPLAARRVLGLGFAMRGTARDTAGLLITSITTGGAAEKAGLNEGDRIVSINGIDLRVPAADAGAPDAVEARVSRLRRALESARDSEPVRLEVLSEGRMRSVIVMPTRERSWSFNGSEMAALSGDLRATMRASVDRAEVERAVGVARAEAVRARAQVQRDMARSGREMATAQREMAATRREMSRSMAPFADRDDRGVMSGRSDGATLALGGITLAIVDRDFAKQFGRGAEDGALVVRIRSDWQPIRAGDVLLTIDGRPVRAGDTLEVTIDRTREMKIELLRNGRRQTVTLPPNR